MKRFSNWQQTSGLASIRIRLGFSQRAFAMHLSVSHSLVCLAEKKKRSLPLHALLKLAQLEILLSTADGNKTGQATENSEHPHQIDSEKAKGCDPEKATELEQHAQLLQYQLKRMQSRYNYLRSCVGQVEKLLDLQAESEVKNLGRTYLELHRYTLYTRLKACSLTLQEGLKEKIALLSTKARSYDYKQPDSI